MGATLLIGKNTVIKKAMGMRAEKLANQKNVLNRDYYEQFGSEGMPQLNNLIEATKGKLGLIFSDRAAFELKPVIESNRQPCTAQVGMIAQCDVTIPTGSTGMDPSQIAFFHALQVSTKINKGAIEIVKEFQVLKKGNVVTTAGAVLLKKLNITPFEYGMELVTVYSDGSILDPAVVNITPSVILEKFSQNVQNITAMSLGLNIPTELSVPHSIANAFKNVCAISLEVKFEIEAMKNLKQAGPATVAAVAAPVAAAKVEVEEEEEEEDVDMGDLFGDF